MARALVAAVADERQRRRRARPAPSPIAASGLSAGASRTIGSSSTSVDSNGPPAIGSSQNVTSRSPASTRASSSAGSPDSRSSDLEAGPLGVDAAEHARAGCGSRRSAPCRPADGPARPAATARTSASASRSSDSTARACGQQRLAGLGQPQRPGPAGTVEDAGADRLLEGGDLLAHRRSACSRARSAARLIVPASATATRAARWRSSRPGQVVRHGPA